MTSIVLWFISFHQLLNSYHSLSISMERILSRNVISGNVINTDLLTLERNMTIKYVIAIWLGQIISNKQCESRSILHFSWTSMQRCYLFYSFNLLYCKSCKDNTLFWRSTIECIKLCCSFIWWDNKMIIAFFDLFFVPVQF